MTAGVRTPVLSDIVIGVEDVHRDALNIRGRLEKVLTSLRGPVPATSGENEKPEQSGLLGKAQGQISQTLIELSCVKASLSEIEELILNQPLEVKKAY